MASLCGSYLASELSCGDQYYSYGSGTSASWPPGSYVPVQSYPYGQALGQQQSYWLEKYAAPVKSEPPLKATFIDELRSETKEWLRDALI